MKNFKYFLLILYSYAPFLTGQTNTDQICLTMMSGGISIYVVSEEAIPNYPYSVAILDATNNIVANYERDSFGFIDRFMKEGQFRVEFDSDYYKSYTSDLLEVYIHPCASSDPKYKTHRITINPEIKE